MKYCNKCGSQSNDGCNYCTKCGSPLGLPTQQITINNIVESQGSIGGGIALGMFLGALGLFISLFLKPKTMKGTIIGFLFGGIILSIIIIASAGTLLPLLAGYTS